MQRRGTVALFLVALALVAYYLLAERSPSNAPVDIRLVVLDPEAVERVTIERGNETVSLERVDTHWEMSVPLRDLADAGAVMRLLAALARAAVERDIGPQDDLAPFGLDTPITIVADIPGQNAVSLRVGGYTVDRALVYAMLDGGDTVVLVPTTLRRYAETAVEDFRYKRVATFDISLVDSFRVTTPGQTMSWRRNDSGWFTTVRGDTIVGNTTAVEGILHRVRALRAIGFPTDEEYSRRDSDPAVTVYRAHSTPPQRFTVAPQPPWFIVEVQPQDRLVLVDTTVTEIFGFSVTQLREKHLLRFDPGQVARIELTTDDTIATILRSGSGWTVPNPAMGDLDNGLVRAALGASGAIEFERVRVERAAVAPVLEGATFRLALWDDGGTIIDELMCILQPGDSLAVATSRSSRLVVEVSASNLRRLEERFQRTQTR